MIICTQDQGRIIAEREFRFLEENRKLTCQVRALEREIALYRKLASLCDDPCFPTKGEKLFS